MTNNRGQEQVHKLIPFERGDAFYYKKAQRYLDAGNYLDALVNLRRAAEMDENNWQYQLELAQLYTEMTEYERSSAIVYRMLHKMPEPWPECYYGLACNCMGLQDARGAEEALQRYLRLEPDGEFVEDALDMLEMLDEPGLGIYPVHEEFADLPPEMFDRMMEGKVALEAGQYEQAVQIFESLLAEEKNLAYVRNNLALAYFALKKIKNAIDMCTSVLRKKPGDVFAHCNMAIFLAADPDRRAEFEGHLAVITKAMPSDPEELFRISVTLCELRRYADAARYIKLVLDWRPYDKRMMHALAVCLYNTAEYSEAVDTWARARKLEPLDPVLEYYHAMGIRAMRGEETEKEIPCHYQVPYIEVVRRLSMINRITIEQDEESIRRRWEEDEEFRALIDWGIHLGEPGIARALAQLLGLIGAKASENRLRDMLLDRDLDDLIKREIMGLLKHNGAEEPYIACIGGSIVEAHINMLKLDGSDLRPDCVRVLELLSEHSEGKVDLESAQKAMAVWQICAAKIKSSNAPPLRAPQAWAAALEYIVRLHASDHPLKGEICSRYGTTLPTMNKCLEQLEQIWEEGASYGQNN